MELISEMRYIIARITVLCSALFFTITSCATTPPPVTGGVSESAARETKSYDAVRRGESFEMQETLWSQIVASKNGPSRREGLDWKVIEGIHIIKNIDGISIGATILSTIINYFDRDKDIWTQDEILRIHRGFRGDQTYGISVSKVLDPYLRRNAYDIPKTVREFGLRRQKRMDVRTVENMDFDGIIRLIDNDTPFIVRSNETKKLFLCLGYVKKDDEHYVVVADVKMVDFGKQYRESSVSGPAAKKLAKQMDAARGPMRTDISFEIARNRQEGIEISRWEPQRFAAYIVEDFHR